MIRAFALFMCLSFCAEAHADPAATPATSDRPFGSSCTYPGTALAAREEGTTRVSYRGTADGHVESVVVVVSSGYPDLDEATAQCVSAWRFNPDEPVAKFYIGQHQAAIAWDISAASEPGPSNPPVGRFEGLPHVCGDAYHRLAERLGAGGGTTRLRFTISTEGSVEDSAVVQSSGNANLDKLSLQCVRGWRYVPASQDGKPVAVKWETNIVWKAPEPPPFAEPPRDCLKSYPVKASDLSGIDGTTEVTFDIIHGEVKNAAVTHSSGNAAMDKSALDCVNSRRYVYDKIFINGDLVDKYHAVTVREQIKWANALKQ
jgi:TonB family protein